MTCQLENLEILNFERCLDALLPVNNESSTLSDRDCLQTFEILGLPPEILSYLVTYLVQDDICSLRQCCKALYQSTDHCMQSLRLCTATVAYNSAYYVHLRPSWLQAVKHLKIYEPSPRSLQYQPHPQNSVAQGCSPVCLWLGLFAPGLSNLQTISIENIPYLIEAMLSALSACPNITCLEVRWESGHREDPKTQLPFKICGIMGMC
jgi:hypothetical protein